MKNGKDKAIISYYDNKYEIQKISVFHIVLFLAYVILSYGFAIYVAFLIRNHVL